MSPGEVLAWALDRHVFNGLCPDIIEGFSTRDPYCYSCLALDWTLDSTGIETRLMHPLKIEWLDPFDGETSCRFGEVVSFFEAGLLLSRATQDRVFVEPLVRGLEGLAWTDQRDYGQSVFSEVVRVVNELPPILRDEFLPRLNSFSSLYLLTEPMGTG